MTNKEYPTAKELLDSGEWKLHKTIKKKLAGLYVYVQEFGQGEHKRYRINKMSFLTKRGVLVYGIVGMVLKPMRWVFNMIFNKGTGDEAFSDIIEEIEEGRLARTHKLDTGKAYGTGQSFGSMEDVDREVEKILRKVEG